MNIPPRFQVLMDESDSAEPVQRLRKGRGRSGAYRSNNPEVRREVRMSTRSERDKVKRAAKSVKITVNATDSLQRIREEAYGRYSERAISQGRNVAPVRLMCQQNYDRITVNFIRHALTVYDESLARPGTFSGQLREDYNREVKRRCLDQIGRAFPELQEECRRQSENTTGIREPEQQQAA